MRPARNTTFIATIADRDGWLFEHVVEAESQAAAKHEVRETLRHWGMTLVEIRRAPSEDSASEPRPSNKVLLLAFAATALVSALARVIVL